MNIQAFKKFDNKQLKFLSLLYFLPAICDYLFRWSDPNTSPGYTYEPDWFRVLRIFIEFLGLVFFIYPIHLKISSKSLLICFCLILCFLDLLFYKYSHELIDPNAVAISSLMAFMAFVGVLSIFKTKYILEESTIKFIYNIFLVGFIIQIFAYYFLGISPSHSPDHFLFPRFSGITNDSLATGLIIPLFIPFLINKKVSIIQMLILILMSIATGSIYSLFITLSLLFFYLAYKKLFSLMLFNFFVMVLFGVIFYEKILYIYSYKINSILVHLDYFIQIYSNNQANCAEVFCESFFAWSVSVSWITTLLFYICLGYMIKKLIDFGKIKTQQVVAHSVLCLGISVLIASLFHPVIIIPFAIKIFFIAFFMLSNTLNNSLNKSKAVS